MWLILVASLTEFMSCGQRYPSEGSEANYHTADPTHVGRVCVNANSASPIVEIFPSAGPPCTIVHEGSKYVLVKGTYEETVNRLYRPTGCAHWMYDDEDRADGE